MNRTRRNRAIGMLAVVSTVAASFVGGVEPATADAAAVYTCTGATNDVAATQTVFFSTTNYTSAQLLTVLSQNIPNFPLQPQLQVSFSANVPDSVVVGSSAFAAPITVSATLPSSLVTAASAFGLSQVTLTNANFAIQAIGGSPATFSDGFASKTVALSPSPVTVTQQVNGTTAPTVGTGEAVLFKPGAASVSVVLNVRVDLLFMDVKTVTLHCTASDVVIAATMVTDSSGTTTTTTTAPPTTAAPSAPETGGTAASPAPPANPTPGAAVAAAVAQRAAFLRFLAFLTQLKKMGCRFKTVKVYVGKGARRHAVRKQVLVCPKPKKKAPAKRR